MLVLFTGGRGSGKSTIASVLYSKLNAIDFDYEHQWTWRMSVQTRFDKIRYYIYFLTFFNFKICGVFLSRLYRDIINKRSKGSLSRVLMPCIFAYYLNKLKGNKVGCVVYESDFVGWSVDKALDGTWHSDEVINYFTRTILARTKHVTVVVCDTPTQIAVERWNEREQQKLTEKEKAQWVAKRQAWKDARSKVITILTEIPNIHVLWLDSSDDPEKNAKIILDHLIGQKLS
jgi:adenylate kinase family enzyme